MEMLRKNWTRLKVSAKSWKPRGQGCLERPGLMTKNAANAYFSRARLLPCWRLRNFTQTLRVMRPFAGLRRWPAMGSLVPKGVDVSKFMVTQLHHNSVWSVHLICLWESSADQSKPRSTGIQLKFASAHLSHFICYRPIYIDKQKEENPALSGCIELNAKWFFGWKNEVVLLSCGVLLVIKNKFFIFIIIIIIMKEEECCPCFGALVSYFGGILEELISGRDISSGYHMLTIHPCKLFFSLVRPIWRFPFPWCKSLYKNFCHIETSATLVCVKLLTNFSIMVYLVNRNIFLEVINLMVWPYPSLHGIASL